MTGNGQPLACGAVGAAHLVSRAEAERRITEIASAIIATIKEPS